MLASNCVAASHAEAGQAVFAWGQTRAASCQRCGSSSSMRRFERMRQTSLGWRRYPSLINVQSTLLSGAASLVARPMRSWTGQAAAPLDMRHFRLDMRFNPAVKLTASPHEYWLPDLGSNQGPTD